ncbi:MAG: hypothetical protein O9275_07035 [Microcystis sp. LE19-196.1B]|nr:hypothetical protein [Microcystis sp. LE19-196.1B]
METASWKNHTFKVENRRIFTVIKLSKRILETSLKVKAILQKKENIGDDFGLLI